MSKRTHSAWTHLTSGEWESCLKILSEFGIYVAQMLSDVHISFKFEEHGDAPGAAYVLKARPKTKGDRLILLEGSRPRPTPNAVCDVLHEAAHIILNDYNRGEDEGVAQVELILSFLVCQRLWKRMVAIHRDVYSWDMEYEDLTKSKRWLRGEEKALRVISHKLKDDSLQLKDAFLYPWADKPAQVVKDLSPESNSPTPLGTRP